MLKQLIQQIDRRYFGWPLRWLTALLRLSATRAQQQHQAELISDLQQQLTAQQQLTQQLAQTFSAASADTLPFSVDKPVPNYLAQAERAVGTLVQTLDTEEKNAAFYSYYSEMYGDQSVLLEAHYEAYLPYLQAVKASAVLDIGCGAGEFLRYLADQGVSASGIDLDAGEVNRCCARGLQARCANALEYLPQTSQKFSAITLFQVVEHMDWSDIRQLFAAVYAALEEGGCFIAETINLRHPLALSGFYTDPTHKLPISDELLCFMFQWAGFENVSLPYLMPAPLAGIYTEDKARIYYNYAVIGYKPHSL